MSCWLLLLVSRCGVRRYDALLSGSGSGASAVPQRTRPNALLEQLPATKIGSGRGCPSMAERVSAAAAALLGNAVVYDSCLAFHPAPLLSATESSYRTVMYSLHPSGFEALTHSLTCTQRTVPSPHSLHPASAPTGFLPYGCARKVDMQPDRVSDSRE
ncbi:hypothetical protein BZA05DRAFT_416889 [Tricharina praecox]|uniref:uncharacterized protein n=1 Tax=Tricharina praecox TaxID=43433 RepID=UPI00221F6FAD|nr:uncharacterized protein BZA05DRAFT_416889 [Tricharina praecox]KAI5855305.1 hypothetical protein BZA05DRAFT_416889 [Tricharina praecox]